MMMVCMVLPPPDTGAPSPHARCFGADGWKRHGAAVARHDLLLGRDY